MKISLLVCAATLLVASLAAAQDTPQYEVFVGGSYLRVHSGGAELTQLLDLSAIQYQPHNSNFNLYGWEASITENLNRWFGGELEASGFYGSPDANFLYPASELVSPSPDFARRVPVITRYQMVMFGPRLTWRTRGNLVFFAHLPIGAAYVNTSLNESAVVASNFTNLPAGTIKSSSGLALSPGVGIEVRLNERVTIRPVQLDYLMTRLLGERQDNARVSAGLSVTFGQK
jgi:opacity protein-like surface antigen